MRVRCHAWWAALPWPLLGGPPVVAEHTGMLFGFPLTDVKLSTVDLTADWANQMVPPNGVEWVVEIFENFRKFSRKKSLVERKIRARKKRWYCRKF